MSHRNPPRTTTPGRIIAHRGASRIAPENTLAAFRSAAEQGARWVEFDVSLLGDGAAVVHHDGRWGRTTDADGPLAGAVRADLANIDAGGWYGPDFAGERVPTLEQTLDLLDELGMSANLEMKAHGDEAVLLADAVTEALRPRGWSRERIVVSSFEHTTLDRLRQNLPRQPIALLWSKPPGDWLDAVKALDGSGVHLNWRNLTDGLLDQAVTHGIEVRVYTINRPDRMTEYRDRLTGVITDHPPLFLDLPDWSDWARADQGVQTAGG